MLRVAFVVKSYNGIGIALEMMVVELVNLFLSQIENFFNRLLDAIDHPLVLAKDLFAVDPRVLDFTDEWTAVSADIIVDVIIVEDMDGHLHIAVRQGMSAHFSIKAVGITDPKRRLRDTTWRNG